MPSDLQLDVQSVTPDVTLTLSDPYIGSAYSPTVTVNEIEGGHEVTITHKAPSGIVTDTFDVLDGVDGTDGVDGVSPTVEIESTTDAHTITITDADGAHSYTVDTYADEEAARATAESSRVAAEQSRVTAESARAAAESSRAAVETARASAETARATAEQSRASAESARSTAEQSRATAETARASAESARASAESTRTSAEQARAAAETARVSAESGRVTAEQGRASAENARVSAESARATAESARANAETSRATAETARSNAELARASEWATIKAEAEDATSAAETATSDANVAASDATAAAAEARAASAATWLSGNVLFGELAEASVLTTDDAYTAPPESVEVYGKSTQSGTPTPDAPVEIKSVDDLTLHVCGKNVCGTITDHADGKRFVGYGVNNTNRYPNLACDLPAGTYTLSMDIRSIESVPVTYGNIRIWARDATDGIIYDPYISTGTKGQQTAGGVVLGVGGYYDNIPTTFTHVSAIINLGFPVSELIFGCYNSGKYIEYQNLQLEYGSTATAYAPYVGQSVEIPLSNHELRSLPDGTRDTVTLSYIGPSTEHEGWGVFSKTLVQRVGEILGSDLTQYNASNGFIAYRASVRPLRDNSQPRCSWTNISTSFNSGNMTKECVQFASMSSFTVYVAALENHSLDDFEYIYPLAEPIFHDLGEVELPILSNPLTAWADGGSAQPTLSMGYEQDINIVIGELRSAIADMATS